MAGDDEVEPTTRDARFIKTAVEILRETGRTDFTVQEVVARSKTSLRAFYQHFSSKDELLIGGDVARDGGCKRGAVLLISGERRLFAR